MNKEMLKFLNVSACYVRDYVLPKYSDAVVHISEFKRMKVGTRDVSTFGIFAKSQDFAKQIREEVLFALCNDESSLFPADASFVLRIDSKKVKDSSDESSEVWMLTFAYFYQDYETFDNEVSGVSNAEISLASEDKSLQDALRGLQECRVALFCPPSEPDVENVYNSICIYDIRDERHFAQVVKAVAAPSTDYSATIIASPVSVTSLYNMKVSGKYCLIFSND